MPLYFAYGTNMDADAMKRRCPRSRVVGQGRLARHGLFVMAAGFVSIRRDPTATVHGVLYDLAFADVPALDKYEEVAAGLYRKISQPVLRAGGAAVRALVYVGATAAPGAPKPGHVATIVAAARQWNFPQGYIDAVTALDPVVATARASADFKAIRNPHALRP